MILLTVEEIIGLHKKLVLDTGGFADIRDRKLLESAVYGAVASFEGQAAYPTISEKAARLSYSLIKNHAFIDGNKRIGILVMLMTLRLNKINLLYSQNELIVLGLGIADGSIGYDDILNWIHIHTVQGP